MTAAPMSEIKLRCNGKHRTYATRDAAESDGALTWAVRIVAGEDGRYHAFERMDDYREFKKLSPTNYR
ncbi:MAG: hypothetical protein IPM07_30715 [Anaerolineales bacterium]|nr:hypothetical protein [Anaerolineales bacterium]